MFVKCTRPQALCTPGTRHFTHFSNPHILTIIESIDRYQITYITTEDAWELYTLVRVLCGMKWLCSCAIPACGGRGNRGV